MAGISDISTVRQLLREEQEAIISYTERADQVTNPEIRAVLLDIAREEKVHSGELMELLDAYDTEEEEAVDEGRNEVDEMNAQEAWEDFVKTAKSNNQTSIEDKIDVLLAQQNEISTDTERIADLVPEMLADEEEQKQIDDIEEEEGIGDEGLGGDEDPYAMLDDFDDGGLLDEGGEEEEGIEGEPEEGEPMMDEETDVVMDDEASEEEPGTDEESFDEETDVVMDDDEGSFFGEETEEETVDEEEADSGEDFSFAEETEGGEESFDEETEEEEAPAEEEYAFDEEEEEDDDKAKKSRRMPVTKSIRSIAPKQRYRIVSKADRIPESYSYGQSTSDPIAKMMDEVGHDTNYGTNTNPREEVRKDWEMYEMMKNLPTFL